MSNRPTEYPTLVTPDSRSAILLFFEDENGKPVHFEFCLVWVEVCGRLAFTHCTSAHEFGRVWEWGK